MFHVPPNIQIKLQIMDFPRILSIFSKISRGMLLLLTITSWKHPRFGLQNVVPKLDSVFFYVIFLIVIVNRIVLNLSFLITSLIFIPLRKTMFFLNLWLKRKYCVGMLLSKDNSDWSTRINCGAILFTIAATYVISVKCQLEQK
jgi:hypothetical protein